MGMGSAYLPAAGGLNTVFFFFLSPPTLVALHGETGAMNAKG